MRVISRYITLELAKIISTCIGVFVVLYLVVDFFERIDDFIEAGLPLSLAVQFFFLKLPLIVQQGIPMGVLMGTLITLGLMARTNELMALKASGVSPVLVVGPVLVFAFILSALDFAFSECLVPLTSSRTNYIWRVKVKGRPASTSFSQEKIWYKSGRVLYNIRVLHREHRLLEGVTIYMFDSNFRLTKRLDAKKAQWDGESWIFADGIFIQRMADGHFSTEKFQRRRVELVERPEDFQHLEKAPEEMTIGELGRYVAKIRSEGYDATRYSVDFHAKLSFPFTPVVMALLGIAVALFQGKQGGIAVGVAVSVALAFLYILVFQLVLSLGYTGNLQPVVAAWTPNIFFSLASMFVFTHAMH